MIQRWEVCPKKATSIQSRQELERRWDPMKDPNPSLSNKDVVCPVRSQRLRVSTISVPIAAASAGVLGLCYLCYKGNTTRWFSSSSEKIFLSYMNNLCSNDIGVLWQCINYRYVVKTKMTSDQHTIRTLRPSEIAQVVFYHFWCDCGCLRNMISKFQHLVQS